jgi:hypothetical protein
MRKLTTNLTALFILTTTASIAYAEEDNEKKLAMQLANPIASLISLPIQANFDEGFGPDHKDGKKWQINVQPVIPISISEDWNLISRTIVPLIDMNDMPAIGSESGVGDITQSLFFSPKAPTAGGLIWGVGPVFLLPTASKDTLGGEQWGAGPTGVVLKQQGPWTIGLLANHIESFAGADGRSDVSATFLQPFASYVTRTKTTFVLNTESTYNWETKEWTVPINFTVAQLFKVGTQIMQAGAGVRYWAQSTDASADDWGLRFQLTFLFPK